MAQKKIYKRIIIINENSQKRKQRPMKLKTANVQTFSCPHVAHYMQRLFQTYLRNRRRILLTHTFIFMRSIPSLQIG